MLLSRLLYLRLAKLFISSSSPKHLIVEIKGTLDAISPMFTTYFLLREIFHMRNNHISQNAAALWIIINMDTHIQ